MDAISRRCRVSLEDLPTNGCTIPGDSTDVTGKPSGLVVDGGNRDGDGVGHGAGLSNCRPVTGVRVQVEGQGIGD